MKSSRLKMRQLQLLTKLHFKNSDTHNLNVSVRFTNPSGRVNSAVGKMQVLWKPHLTRQRRSYLMILGVFPMSLRSKQSSNPDLWFRFTKYMIFSHFACKQWQSSTPHASKPPFLSLLPISLPTSWGGAWSFGFAHHNMEDLVFAIHFILWLIQWKQLRFGFLNTTKFWINCFLARLVLKVKPTFFCFYRSPTSFPFQFHLLHFNNRIFFYPGRLTFITPICRESVVFCHAE